MLSKDDVSFERKEAKLSLFHYPNDINTDGVFAEGAPLHRALPNQNITVLQKQSRSIPGLRSPKVMLKSKERFLNTLLSTYQPPLFQDYRTKTYVIDIIKPSLCQVQNSNSIQVKKKL